MMLDGGPHTAARLRLEAAVAPTAAGALLGSDKRLLSIAQLRTGATCTQQ